MKLPCTHIKNFHIPIRPMANAQSMIMPQGTWRRDYCGNVIYKDGQIERVLTPEGYAVPDGEGWKRYVYVRDVQGNIRAVVGENKPEGYAVPDGEGWKRYVYVRDVQGNIRAVVGENNAVSQSTMIRHR